MMIVLNGIDLEQILSLQAGGEPPEMLIQQKIENSARISSRSIRLPGSQMGATMRESPAESISLANATFGLEEEGLREPGGVSYSEAGFYAMEDVFAEQG